ncbi:MAG: outer membrane homotrimeric porin [Deltaproteobacteria bacterium]|jgi:hypothetical protein|nr:outer membrane homotrimeric porin [Deltaproteobacteria bacterium]
MKRLATLLMALCLVLGSAVSASAIEVQVSGLMDFVFGYNNNLGFGVNDDNESAQERTMARQRARIVVELIASENLRGVFQFQIGHAADWGVEGEGAMWDGEGGPDFQVRQAYINYMLPNTDVRVKMGYQPVTLPYANQGNPMYDGIGGAVVVSAGLTEDASLTAFWARPYSSGSQAQGAAAHSNMMDSFGLVFDYSSDVFSVSPWVMYTMIGQNSGFFTGDDSYVGDFVGDTGIAFEGDADHYAFGVALKVMPTDALTIKFDGMYGSMSADAATEDFEMKGYWFALGVDYAMDWGTPGFFAWYTSGDDADDLTDNEFGRLPALAQDGGVWFSSFGFAGGMGAVMDGNLNGTGIGTMGLGLQIANMSFVENLSHTVRALYWEGTNDDELLGAGKPGYGVRDGLYLTTKDSVYELNVNSYYNMYDNLTVGLELGYMYLDVDSASDYADQNEDSYSAALVFRYGF